MRGVPYLRLTAGQFLAILAGQTYLIAVSAVVTPLWGTTAFGAIYATDLVARVLTIALAGFFVDRVHSKTLLWVADLSRALAFVGLAVAAATSSLWGFFPLAVVIAIASSLAPVVMPSLFGRAARDDAERRSQLGRWRIANATATLVGPALAALTVPMLGPTRALLLAALLFLVALGADLLIPSKFGSVGSSSGPVLREALLGYKIVWQAPHLRWLLFLDVLHVLFPVATWMLIIQSPTLIGLKPGEQGWVLSAFAVGGLVGAMFSRRVAPRALGTAIVVAQALFALPLVGLGAQQTIGLPALIVLALIGGGGNEASSMWMSLMITREASPETLGRVFSVNMLTSVAAMPLGIVFVTWALARFDPLVLCSAAAIFLIASSTAVLPLLLRRNARVH